MADSLTEVLVLLYNNALDAVRHTETVLDAMGLLKRRTQFGTLHIDRVVLSVEKDKAGD